MIQKKYSNMLKNHYTNIFLFVITLTCSHAYAIAAIEQPSSIFSGELGLVSQYIYRGGEENDQLSLQAGLQYSHASGWNVGYWGSTLNYQPKNDKDHGFEHDLYIGYECELNDNWQYAGQLVSYIYQGGGTIYAEDGQSKRPTTGTELIQSLSYQNFSADLGIMLTDVDYANAGDVYLQLAYSHALANDFSIQSSFGFSFYNDNRDDEVVATIRKNNFTEARLGLSKDLDNGISIGFDYIWGGRDRYKQDFDDHAVFGLNYSF